MDSNRRCDPDLPFCKRNRRLKIMLDQIVLWEREAFLWINNLHSPFWDSFFYLISARWSWTAIVIALIFWVYRKRPLKEAVLFTLFVILMFIFSDQLSSGIAKPFFSRERPAFHVYTESLVRSVFNEKGAGFGFFSGHATNFFAIATFTAMVFRRKSYTFLVYFLVTLVAYSRIYLGKHFLSDVLVGIVAGILTGWLFFTLYRLSRPWLFTRFYSRKSSRDAETKGLSSISLPRLQDVFGSNIREWECILIMFLFFLVFVSLDFVNILRNIGYISPM